MSQGDGTTPDRSMVLMSEAERLTQLEQFLERRVSMLGAAVRETANAIESVRAAEGEALMPVGAGVFVRARIEPESTLVVSVGSGVSVEKTRDSTLLHLEARSKELVAAGNEAAGQLGQVQQQMQRIRTEIDSLVGTMQAGQNV